MPIFFPFKRTLPLCASALLCATLLPTANAQTLARPGWAGSGLTSELWWRNAVFYRIDVPSFQDSNGDGSGDLRGVADRMDYLQTLGLDAIVLDHADVKDEGFDDTLHAAIPRQIRVLVMLDDKGSGNDEALAAEARSWLTRGASGIFLRSTRSANDAAPLIARMRTLTNSFAGGRVLLAQTATNPAPSTIHAITFAEQQPVIAPARRGQAQAAGAQLTAVPLELTNATAKTIRAALTGLNAGAGTGSLFLTEQLFSSKELLAPEHLAALDGRRRAFALVLLASRGAASLRYGQEIGMLPVEGSANEVMQWTPTNVTAPPKAEAKDESTQVIAPVPATKPSSSGEYGGFVPYVAPKRPATPVVKTAEGQVVAPPPEPVDPNTLPGFTAGKPAQPVPSEAAKLNAAVEDADPESLLNLYRRLIQLHHDNPSLRNGTETLLDYDGLEAVVWVRQPPRDSRSTAIIAVCNLSSAPLHLSLNQELTQQHIKTGTIRNLLSTMATESSVQSTDNLTLPPYGVFLGELYH